ncbi:MAG: DUF167 domain-containing protein [Pseudomonadota bacterium]
MKIKIKVIPGASQEGVEWFGDMLKVKVRTPPEKGRANTAVENLVATKLGLTKSAVHVVTGLTHSIKTIEIIGIDENYLRNMIS